MNETTETLSEYLMRLPAKQRRKLLKMFDEPLLLREYDTPEGAHVRVMISLKLRL